MKISIELLHISKLRNFGIFRNIGLPLIHRAFPSIFASRIVGVKPIENSKNLVEYLCQLDKKNDIFRGKR